jgi:hypothetical protein
MPLDFPNNPALNDTYSFNGRTWSYNGTAWQVVQPTAINGLPIGNSTPSTGVFTTLSATGNITGSSNLSVSGNITANINVSATGNISATGNVVGNFILGNGSQLTGVITSVSNITNGLSKVEIASANANIVATVANTTVMTITTAGILNNLGNGVGNIGNATGYYNTIFAKATSAQYADLAEMYVADAAYEPGTVVSFGGEFEITESKEGYDRAVAGVVSSNPSYLMNTQCQGQYTVPVALVGKVPVKILGPCTKGDIMVSAGNGYAQRCDVPLFGSIIGKAIENFDGESGVVNIVVGRF